MNHTTRLIAPLGRNNLVYAATGISVIVLEGDAVTNFELDMGLRIDSKKTPSPVKLQKSWMRCEGLSHKKGSG